MYSIRKYYSNTFHILKELKDRKHNFIEDSKLYALWLLILFNTDCWEQVQYFKI